MENETKHHITAIFPDKLGGVYILMKNLIDYFPNKSYNFHVLLTNLLEDKYPVQNNLFDKRSSSKFSYSKYENRYSVYRKLKRKIDKNTDIIIANDWLELEMIAATKFDKKIIFILHGDYDYYYNLASIYSGFIDKFITVSDFIKQRLLKLLPDRLNDIYYLKNIIANPVEKNTISIQDKRLKALFVGRLTEDKGYFDLEKIDQFLKQKGEIIDWTIIGSKIYSEDKYAWLNIDNVKWLGSLSNSEVLSEYHLHDIFVLPTRAEGLGMVIVEAMKAGCVPIVSKLDAGIPEFVVENLTGFMIPLGDMEGYCKTISKVKNTPGLLEEVGKNAIAKVNELFDPHREIIAYYKLFEVIINTTGKKKKYPQLALSKLDKPWLPNFLVKLMRFTIYKIK